MDTEGRKNWWQLSVETSPWAATGAGTEEGRPVSCCCCSWSPSVFSHLPAPQNQPLYMEDIYHSPGIMHSGLVLPWPVALSRTFSLSCHPNQCLPGPVLEKGTWPEDFAQDPRAGFFKSQGTTHVSQAPSRFLLPLDHTCIWESYSEDSSRGLRTPNSEPALQSSLILSVQIKFAAAGSKLPSLPGPGQETESLPGEQMGMSFTDRTPHTYWAPSVCLAPTGDTAVSNADVLPVLFFRQL